MITQPKTLPADETNQTLALMKKTRRWHYWKYFSLPERDRVEVYYGDGERWSRKFLSYDEAIYPGTSGVYSGLGFALENDNMMKSFRESDHWQMIVLSDIVANKLEDIAIEWINGVHSDWCYVELTPCGKGIQIIGYGRPFSRELYDHYNTGIVAYSSRSFFPFTGMELRPEGKLKQGLVGDLYNYVEVLRPRSTQGMAGVKPPWGTHK